MNQTRTPKMGTIKQLTGMALGLAVATTIVTPSFAQRGEVSPERAQALRDCNGVAKNYKQYTWGATELNHYRACMAQHGQQE
jgi:hypothetical protein